MTRVSTPDEAIFLNRSDARTLHEQLSDMLRPRLIEHAKPGDKILTEDEICRTYQLSRVTVRRAIQTLVDQGLLVRRQGKGTFVTGGRPKVVYEINRIAPFMKVFETAGESTDVRLLDWEWLSKNSIPTCFPEETRALNYKRLYYTRQYPHALLQICVPSAIGDRITRRDATSFGIYEILKKRLKLVPTHVDFSIGTELAGARLAPLLEVSPTAPLLVLERLSRDRAGKTIERTVHYLLPDVYKLHVSADAKD